MEPFDIFMPTHNSAKLLPVTLPQISKVIPPQAIHAKLVIDDYSTDNTLAVAKALGWTTIRNRVKGLSNAQKYGRSLVSTNYYAIFEHDVYLTTNWYPTIPNLVISGKYDTAQGIRVRNVTGFKEADLYDYEHRPFQPTPDNTFFTKYPTGKGYRIEKTVCSLHLRGTITECLRHDYKFDASYGCGVSNRAFLKSFLHSPYLSLKIFRCYKKPQVLILYPMEKLFTFAGGLFYAC